MPVGDLKLLKDADRYEYGHVQDGIVKYLLWLFLFFIFIYDEIEARERGPPKWGFTLSILYRTRIGVKWGGKIIDVSKNVYGYKKIWH